MNLDFIAALAEAIEGRLANVGGGEDAEFAVGHSASDEFAGAPRAS